MKKEHKKRIERLKEKGEKEEYKMAGERGKGGV